VVTGIAVGVSPALHATRLAVADVLKAASSAGGTRRPRLQTVLVIAQIAVTQPALLAMGALINEMVGDLRALPDSTFAASILDVRFNTNPRYGAMDEAREGALRGLRARIGGLPGVAAVVPQEIVTTTSTSPCRRATVLVEWHQTSVYRFAPRQRHPATSR
jgi:hypothetical protein